MASLSKIGHIVSFGINCHGPALPCSGAGGLGVSSFAAAEAGLRKCQSATVRPPVKSGQPTTSSARQALVDRDLAGCPTPQKLGAIHLVSAVQFVDGSGSANYV